MSAKIPAKRVALLGLFLAYALIVGYVERFLPMPVGIPGVKLGLGNVVVLAALYLFSAPEALLLTLLKCGMSALFAGSFTALLYSTAGALLSFAGMWVLLCLLREKIGPIGVSVAGAVLHNIGQMLVASAVMQTWLIGTYLPVLLLSGAITGVLVGVLVGAVMGLVRRLGG